MLPDARRMLAEKLLLLFRQGLARQQAIHRLCNLLVTLALAEELREVGIPAGIEQAQPGEMSFRPELLRRRREQQQTRGARGQRRDQFILGAGLRRAPREVVRFIDDEKVPPGLQGLLSASWRAREEGHGAKHELAVEKRIRRGIMLLDRRAALLVEKAEEQIEAAQELHEPLVNQRLRHEHQHARRAPGEVQAVQDQARLDRFAEPDLVCQQHAWQQTAGDFARDRKLVRNEIDPSPHEAAHR
jgi:hypothetical protein